MLARVASRVLAAQAVVGAGLHHQHRHRLRQQPVDTAQRAGRGLAAHAGVDHAVAQAGGLEGSLDQGGKRLGGSRP